MLRSNAVDLYGWSILFKGTFWPGPLIGRKLEDTIAETAETGHEVGLYAWDHHQWQTHVDEADGHGVRRMIDEGMQEFMRITGKAPACSAAPGWKCTDTVLREKARYSFTYNSDCRGAYIFRPAVDGRGLEQPQVPLTLPTYDEVIGRDGITNDNYNDRILGMILPGQLNVLTIYTEVEGIAYAHMFDDFLRAAKERGVSFVPWKYCARKAKSGRLRPSSRDRFPGAEVCWPSKSKPRGESNAQR